MIARLVMIMVGLCAALIFASDALGQRLPAGRQIAFSAWVNNRMMTQIVDVERGAGYRLPLRIGSTTPVAWLDREQLLLTLRRVEFGAQPGAGVLRLGQPLRVLSLPANCFTDTVAGAGGYIACLERDGTHLLVQTLACALAACETPARQIASEGAIFGFLWSPTGEHLALVTVENLGMAIEVIRADDGARVFTSRRLGTANPRPIWSADGRRLAFLMRLNREMWLQVIDLQDPSAPNVVRLSMIDLPRPFTLSPDGEQIMIVNDTPPGTHLEVIDLGSSAATAMTQGLFIPVHQYLQWSPDGTQVAAYAQRDDLGGGLVLIEAATGTVRMLASTPLLGDHFVWRPCPVGAC